jgi:hypothetical protein
MLGSQGGAVCRRPIINEEDIAACVKLEVYSSGRHWKVELC